MPNIFDYEFGELGTPSTDQVWEQWVQGTLGDDWSYTPVAPPSGYDEYGIPQLGYSGGCTHPNQISCPVNGEVQCVNNADDCDDYSGFQQFVPEGISFMDFLEGYLPGSTGDQSSQEGFQSVDWWSYSSDVDALSDLNQEELALALGVYGFEYLEDLGWDNVETAVEAAGGIDALGELFAEQYGGNIPAFSTEVLDYQSAEFAAQEASIWASYANWEESQLSLLAEELEQLGINYLTNDYTQSRDYKNTLKNLTASEADYLRGQIEQTRSLSNKRGRSGLGGGTLAGLEAKAGKSIRNQLDQIQAQRDNARRAYQLGQTSAAELYEMNAQNLVESFQQIQAGQLLNLEDTIDSLVSEFELDAGAAYSGWYLDLIDQMSTLDIFEPGVTVGDYLFDWSPFGMGAGDPDAVGYSPCAPGQSWDPSLNDGEGDCVDA
jgi:hypothetical protein